MTEFKIAEYDEVAAELDKIKETSNFIPDASTDEGYEKSKRVSLDIGKVKTKLEKARKAKKAHFLEGGKQVDSQAKLIMAKLDDMQQPHMLAYKELGNLKKEREANRKQELQNRVDYMVNLTANMADAHSSEVQAAISFIQAEECLDYYEFTKNALEAKNKASVDLMALFTRKLKEEADAKELEELRKAQSLRDQQDREEEIKRQATEKAEFEKNAAIVREQEAQQRAIDLEREKLEAEKELAQRIEEAKVKHEEQQAKAESARIEAEKQAKINEEKAAEQARLNEIARQDQQAKAEADALAKREANKKHIGKIRGEAKDALINLGLDEKQAKAVVLAIHSSEVPNVSIQY